MRKPLVAALTFSLAVMLLCYPVMAQQAPITDAEIQAAIDRMVASFYQNQNADGSWERDFVNSHDPDGGETALVVYALMQAGQSHQSPQLAKAIQWLRQKNAAKTYSVGIRCHVWASLPDEYLPQLGKDAQWLLGAAHPQNSTFSYGYQPGRIDNSTTQYGILGLWEFAKRDGKVPKKFWENAVKHFLAAQNSDGGWAYGADGTSRGSMVAAGLTVLFVAKQQLYTDADDVPKNVLKSIDDGLAWLDKNFGPNNINGGHNNYYRYGIERVALASGYAEFGGKDWFETCAQAILKSEGGKGNVGKNDETAFALAFLARGRVPVWIRKLRIEGQEWNKRYNDLYNLNGWVSDTREQELVWQISDIKSPSTRWLNTPLVWASSSQKWELTDGQKRNLKRYLDLGGTLVINNERGQVFSNSMEALLKELYPDYSFKEMPDDHPMLTVNYRLDMPPSRRPRILSNGARDIAYMLREDWGSQFQKKTRMGETPWQAMLNLYVATSNRGRLPNRLEGGYIHKSSSQSKTGDTVVARVQYDGNWLPEPSVYNPIGNIVYNQSGLEVTTLDTLLDELGDAQASMAHLSGIDKVELTPAQIDAIKAYIGKGGTLLVETVGGLGLFSFEIEKQLRDALNVPSGPLSSSNAIISGQNLKGFNNSTVTYRPYTVLRASVGNRPRFKAMIIDDRPAIIFSHDDLSVGAVGGRQFEISGYDIQSSRHLLANMILNASKTRPTKPSEKEEAPADDAS